MKRAVRISKLRDILAALSSDWDSQREAQLWGRAARVVPGLRGAHSGLEPGVDVLPSRRGALV